MRPALLVLAALCAVVPAAAQKPERPLVFVADLSATAGLQQDAAALTTALCGLLAKDPRIEVLCAPDVKQIMSFAAMGSLTGAPSPAIDTLERRLAAVKYVVNGSLAQRDGDAFVLVVSAGTRVADGGGGTPTFETASVRLEEAAKGKSTRLIERLPELAARLTKPLLAPATTSTTAPPEPLK